MQQLKFFLLKQKKLSSQFQVIGKSLIFNREIKKKWPIIAGKLSQVLFFRYCRYNTLYLTTKNASWKNEIAYIEKKLLQKLHQYLPKTKKISKVRVVIDFNHQEESEFKVKKRQGFSLDLLKKKMMKRDQEKKKNGYRLCATCNKVWVKKLDMCALCRLQY